MYNRYRKINSLNLTEVEQEIDLLIDLAGDDPSNELIDEVTKLIRLAKALGTTRKW